MQVHDGIRPPFGHWSQTVPDRERRYSTTEPEVLATVWVLTILRAYVEHTRFTVTNHHHSSRLFLEFPDSDADTCPTVWRLSLAEYSYDVIYQKISEKQGADALSRITKDGETTMRPSKNIYYYLRQPAAAMECKEFCKSIHPLDTVFDIEDHELRAL